MSSAEEVDTLVKMIRSSAWIPLLSVVVAAIIRLCKSDAAVAWFRVTIRPERRAWYALGLAIAGGSVEQMVASSGGGWLNTLVGGVVGGMVAGTGAIAAHELVINGIRKGRDIGVKKTPPSDPPVVPLADWVDDSQRPPPKPTIIPTWPKLAAAAIAVVVLAACPGAGKVVCPVIDLASTLCPLILVKMPDGSQEIVPRDRIADTAMRVRLIRIHGEAQAERDEIDRLRRLEHRDGGAE